MGRPGSLVEISKHSAAAAAKDAARRQVRERAKAEEEATRLKLQQQLEEQDLRRAQKKLHTDALVQKRLASAFDPTPARRKMYDDDMLAMASQVPGPGEYTPRLQQKDSSGKTFGPGPSATQTWGQAKPVPSVGGMDWMVKQAALTPGPASYSPKRQTAVRGFTFGLPPALTHGRVVPSAHDMSIMVAHLRDLPAPDAYSPRNPVEKNKGFRIRPSNARSSLEQQMLDASKSPGPGAYDLSAGLSGGRSTILKSGGQVKSELEIVMERAKQLPGPGAYGAAGSLRSRGSPRFSGASQKTLIETIIAESQTKPGPGTYHQTPTFGQELEMRRYKKAVIKGEPVVPLSLSSPTKSPYSSPTKSP